MNGVGEALVDVLLHTFVECRPRVRRVVDWITEAARPPAGVRLVADDGSEYTGIVLVEANRPRLMFALRVGAGARPAPPTTYYGRETHYLRHELDDEFWPHDRGPST